MNLIISGSNGVGKTSLASRLKEQFPSLIMTHFSNPKDMADGKKQYFDFVDSMSNDKDYLFDRFHDGEWVYAPIFRGYTADYLLEFESKLYDLDYVPFFIYVCADLRDIIKRIEKRGEDFVKPEHYPIERENFDKFIISQHLPYCVINTSQLHWNGTFKKTMESIKKYESMRILTKGWDKVPRGDINADVIYVVKDEHSNGKILRPDIAKEKTWITTNKNLEAQYDIIEPLRIVYEKDESSKTRSFYFS